MEDVLDPNLTPNAACQCEANMARVPTDPTPSPSAVPTISTSPSATPTISSAPSTSNQPTKTWVRPNFIVMQPDDLDFFERWTPPVHFPTMGRTATMPASHVLSNMERLRTKGLHMKQAYTASSKVCSPQHPLALVDRIVLCFISFLIATTNSDPPFLLNDMSTPVRNITVQYNNWKIPLKICHITRSKFRRRHFRSDDPDHQVVR